MNAPRSLSAWCLIGFIALLGTSGTRAGASPYYEVLDTGSLSPQEYIAVHSSPVVPLTDAERKDLPGVHGYQGTFPPVPTFFPMRTSGANGAGTILGVVPSGESRAMPYSTVTVGYAQRQPDGHFGPFVPLSSVWTAEAFLNSQNQILLSGSGVDPKRIIDLNEGTSTDFASIVSPETLDKYGPLFPYGLADNGAILASYYIRDSGQHPDLILAPPGLAQPVPAPEPAALVTLAIGLGGMALRRRRDGKGARSRNLRGRAGVSS